MPTPIRRIVRSRLLQVAAGLFAAYLLFSYFAVDPLARRLVPWIAERNLASRAEVGQVAFDPFRLTVTVHRMRLMRADGAPLAGFERLFLDLQTSSLLRLVWRFKEVRLNAPQAVFDIAPDGRFNWSELLARLNRDSKPSDTIPRVLIDRIVIERGDLRYAERNRPVPFTAALEPFGLELHHLSTLAEDRGDYQLAATLPQQGGTLRWKGSLSLNPIASAGAIEAQGLKLAELMRIAPAALPLQIGGGDLHAAFEYAFRMTRGERQPLPEAELKNLALDLNNVKGKSGHADLALAQLKLKLPRAQFSMQHGAQLSWQDMELGAADAALQSGNATLAKLAHAQAKGIAFDLAAGKLKIGEVVLSDGALQANRSAGGELDWQRALGAAPPSAPPSAPAGAAASGKPLDVEIGAVRLDRWQAEYRDASFRHPLSLAVQGINLGATLTQIGGVLKVGRIESRIGPLVVKSAAAPQPAATIDMVALQGGELDFGARSARLATLQVKSLQTKVVREAGKPLNWLAMLEPALAKPDAKAAPPAAPSEWKVALDRIALEDGAVRLEDRSGAKPVALDVKNASLEIRDATLDAARALPLRMQFKLGQGGEFKADGKLTPSPLKADLKFALQKMSLKPFSPYVNQFAFLTLERGNASIGGTVALRQGKTLNARFAGSFSVDDLSVNEENSANVFIGWKSLGSTSLKLDLSPKRVHMDELRVADPIGKVIIHEDKSVNIQRIMRPQAAPAVKAGKGGEAAEFPVAVERLRIDNGELDFADLSLVPQFGTHIHTLSGVVNGLSTRADTTAQVELDGKVDEYGSARIRGTIQPFRATDFTDLVLAFQNIEMNRLTPYSGKFAGRKIESGKMSVRLEYKIKQRQLAGENKFVINKLKLGERVDSPDAVNLPLDLAIALLEDSDGVMDLDLPISGSLDDPQFSYGKIIWKAIVNVIGKIVTAPFRALGKLLGVESDKLEAVAFDPGSAELSPPEQEKLKTVAQALAKRPGLALTIAPAYDPVRDKAALQQNAIRRDVLQELGVKLQPGEKPGPVDLRNPKVQAIVLKMSRERSPEAKNRGLFDKLKDMLDTSKPSDPAAYQAMLKQLEQWVPVSEQQLTALAEARGEAMRQALAQAANLPPNRVAKGKPAQVTSGGNDVALKMSLERAK